MQDDSRQKRLHSGLGYKSPNQFEMETVLNTIAQPVYYQGNSPLRILKFRKIYIRLKRTITIGDLMADLLSNNENKIPYGKPLLTAYGSVNVITRGDAETTPSDDLSGLGDPSHV